MVKKLAGKAAGATNRTAKSVAKEAAGTVKRNVIDEATKPIKEAAKKKVNAFSESLKSKAESKVREVVKEQLKKDVKKKLFRK